jgi:IclR family KDG regulon transcriptional repressor
MIRLKALEKRETTTRKARTSPPDERPNNERGSRYLVPMVQNALMILEAFAGSDAELTLTEVGSRANVGTTSTFRILHTLAEHQYVIKNPSSGKYRLGHRMMQAAWRPSGPNPLIAAARPYLEQLRSKFNETINLAMLRDGEIVYVEILESSRPFRMSAVAGSAVPLHATALGKAIGAFLATETLNGLLQTCNWIRFTPHTLTSRTKWLAGLAKVKADGYAYDHEEAELGASCIAAPILDKERNAFAGISIAAPTPRILAQRREMTNDLKRAAAEIGLWA